FQIRSGAADVDVADFRSDRMDRSFLARLIVRIALDDDLVRILGLLPERRIVTVAPGIAHRFPVRARCCESLPELFLGGRKNSCRLIVQGQRGVEFLPRLREIVHLVMENDGIVAGRRLLRVELAVWTGTGYREQVEVVMDAEIEAILMPPGIA